ARRHDHPRSAELLGLIDWSDRVSERCQHVARFLDFDAGVVELPAAIAPTVYTVLPADRRRAVARVPQNFHAVVFRLSTYSYVKPWRRCYGFVVNQEHQPAAVRSGRGGWRGIAQASTRRTQSHDARH